MTLETGTTISTPPTRISVLRSIFVGTDGLRAGWSLILFLFLVVVIGKVGTLLLNALSFLGHSGPMPQVEANPLLPEQFIPIRLRNFFVLAIATWIMSRIERRPLSAYGSGGPRRLWNLSIGCLSGLGCLSALAGCLWASGFLMFDGLLLHGTAILRWGTVWAIGFLLLALFEETSLRAYMQFTLTRGIAGIYGAWFKAKRSTTLGFWTAAALLACLFMSNHSGNPGESGLGLAEVGLFAMLMCFSLWRTGSLWWAIGFHAAFDWGESFLFGVANSGWIVKGRLLASHPSGNSLLSGGLTGPEGSLLATLAFALGVIILVWTTPRSHWLVANNQIG